MKKKIFNNFRDFAYNLKKIKNSKKKIVLCHGVFDLYHAGHLNYFEEAKKYADVLIVTITSDKFVKKAPNRPFFGFNERAKVISSIRLIDFVIKSDFETSEEVIHFIKPDIYFKGSDYKDNKKDLTGNIIKEIQKVKKFKGKIKYSTGKTFSSSKILNTFNEYNKLQKKTIDYIKSNYTYYYIEKNIFNQLSKEKVLIVGDTIIDKFIFTKNLGMSGKEAIRTVEKISEKN